MVARIGAALGFLCGVIGLLAGLTDQVWILGPLGWLTGGILLTLLAVYALVDGAVAFEKARPPK
jgi:hypothetical protein